MKYICFAAVMISLQDALIQVAYYPWGQIGVRLEKEK
jgi:hypothetical protein